MGIKINGQKNVFFVKPEKKWHPMGSGASTPLQCPKGYDPEKFQRICTMFDHLDSDSDMGVGAKESSAFAKMYIQEMLRSLAAKQNGIQREMEHDLASAEAEYTRCCETARANADAKKKCMQAKHAESLGAISGKIAWLSTLPDDDCGRVFVKDVAGDADGKISFWKFFNFMKSRV